MDGSLFHRNGTKGGDGKPHHDPIRIMIRWSFFMKELMEMGCILHSSELCICIMCSCVALSLFLSFGLPLSFSLSDSDSDSELSVDEHSSSYASSHSSDSEDDDMDIKPKWNNERQPQHSTPKGTSIASKGSHHFPIQNTPQRYLSKHPGSHCSESTAAFY